jgi:hypothetical protein
VIAAGRKALAAAVALGVSAAASFQVDMRVTRTVTGARLRLAVSDSRRHAILRSFRAVHDHPMHLFVVGGSGLRVFRHEFPEQQRDGSFQADVALPESGAYMAFAEFEPLGAPPQWFQQTFTNGTVLPVRPGDPVDEPHAVSGIRATLDASRAASGGESALLVTVDDESSGAAIADLEPYLGGAGHLFVVSADLTEGFYVTSQDGGRGPRLAFTTLFPRPGRYKLWLELQRAGRLSTIPFVIDVR